MNIFDYKPQKYDFLTALFSVSNVINGTSTESLLKMRSSFHDVPWIATYPIGSGIRNEVRPNGVSVSDYELMVSQLIPLGFHFMTMSDFVAFLEFGTELDSEVRLDYDSFFTGTPGSISDWVVVFEPSTFEFSYQTWINSQTHFARLTSPVIRTVAGLRASDTYSVRRLVLVLFGRYYKRGRITDKDYGVIRPLLNRQINGVRNRRFIAISGHIINLLICSTFLPFDWVRHWRTIELNVQNIRPPSRYVTNRLLSEWNNNKTGSLWHNVDDMYLGIISYLLWCYLFDIPVNVRAIRYLLKQLSSILHLPRSFSLPTLIKDFLLTDPNLRVGLLES
jgi:hypothetical protein